MKKMFVLIAVIFLATTLFAYAQGNQLSGKWQMSFDPDGPVVNDWMLFHSNGIVEFGDDGGVYITCKYVANKANVQTICNVRGQEKRLHLEVREDFVQLVNSSGAIYTKKHP